MSDAVAILVVLLPVPMVGILVAFAVENFKFNRLFRERYSDHIKPLPAWINRNGARKDYVRKNHLEWKFLVSTPAFIKDREVKKYYKGYELSIGCSGS